MAVRGEDGKLELAIHDYPYANDGLLIWDAIKQWAFDYVAHYYPCAVDIVDDVELQAWWNEVRTKGHADKKDEPWWPKLDCHESSQYLSPSSSLTYQFFLFLLAMSTSMQ
ncbi:Lipoxygenase 2.2, chloroplastic [Hordeum vulgare]|nr:Lipoxygenase 2.2, chloroplastic [Hordeum vulgare]